jgi:predicted ATPase/DNA-binding SARP family transcriptional activator
MMADSPLSIRMLGVWEVRVGGQPLPSLRPHSVEWLLALLALRHGRGYPQSGWISRSWLAGSLWPESSEANGLYNLRRNLVALRQALGAEAARLRTPNRATLGLDLTGATVDVVGFDAAIAAGDEPSLQAAVALYRGPLLEGCVEEWVLPERASREEACLQTLETLADRRAARGDLAAALGYLAQAAALDPLRDSTQRRRMQWLAAGGDLPAAVHTYREHRLRLYRELNAEPDPETTALFQTLRAGGQDRENGRGGEGESGRPGKVKVPLSSHRPASPSSGIPVSPSSPPPVSPAPLPRPLTALIGREQEVRAVVESVRAARLVTLTGGGGVGKTRLAIQAAAELAPDFPAGVAFLELAALADPALLPAHVAAALGVREADAAAGGGPEAMVQALAGWLIRHVLLLVLDNCEHMLPAAASLVHALLAAGPELRILTTSRQRLGITGEVVRRVPSLPVPVDGSWSGTREAGGVDGPAKTDTSDPSTINHHLSTLTQCPSVQLFVERAAAARPEFRLEGREDALAVAQICRRLDGIPLALELAAARVGPLTLLQIAARLDDRFHLLTGGSRAALPRQQTLQALIDWSYELLPEAERALLRRLSVFAGGWTLEAAEAVCADQVDGSGRSGPSTTNHQLPTYEVLDLLGALEEKSLVLVELRDGAIRYRMLETVREYAREKLEAGAGGAEGGGTHEVGRVPPEGRAGAREAGGGPGPGRFGRAADSGGPLPQAGTRPAKRVAAPGEGPGYPPKLGEGPGPGGELAAIRDRHRDWYLQLAEQFAAAIDRPEHVTWLVRLEAELDNLRAALAWCREEAHADSESAAEAWLRLAHALNRFWLHRGYIAEGLQWLQGALGRSGPLSPALRAPAFLAAAHLASSRGGRDQSRSFLRSARAEQEEVLCLARVSGTPAEIAPAVLVLADIAHQMNDLDVASELWQEARELTQALGDRMGLLRALGMLGGIAWWRGDGEAARPLLEEQLALCRELGASETLVHTLGALGHLTRDQGDYAQARAFYSESLVLRREAGHWVALAQSLEDLAALDRREQQFERAIRLLGAGEAFCETLGARPPVALVDEYERTVAEGRAALGEAAFAAAWAKGRAMSLEAALECALSAA